MKYGDLVYIEGDSTELWIKGYNVRVSSYGVVALTPEKGDKKVMVCIDTIDGDRNVFAKVRKNKLRIID